MAPPIFRRLLLAFFAAALPAGAAVPVLEI